MGAAVARDRVGEAVTASVGVSVTGALDGRLQADRISTRTSKADNLRGFIASLLLFVPSYLTRMSLTRDHLDAFPTKEIERTQGVRSI